MEYKSNFEGQNVWIDVLKDFYIANEENKAIFEKFCPNVFK